MYTLRPTTEFRRNVRRLRRQRADLSPLETVLKYLRTGAPLPDWCRDGHYRGAVRRCTVGAAAITCAVLITRRSLLELLQTKE